LTDDAAFSDEDEGAEEAWPDWLAEDEEEAPSSEASESDVAPPDEDLPDWLSGIMMDSEAPESGPEEAAPAPEPASEEEEDFAPSELPDWLVGLSEEEETEEMEGVEEEAEATEEIEPMAPDELPDWLSGISGAPEEEAPAAASSMEPTPTEPEEEEEPDWFAGWEEEAEEEEEIAEAPAPTLEEDFEAETRAPAPEASASYPDWLTADAVDVGSAPPPQPQPDWLHQHAVETPAPGPSQELPPWLLQHTAEGPSVGAPSAPAELEEKEAAAAEQPPEPAEEMPDWLRGMAEEKVEAAPAPEPEPQPEEEEGEMPDWLRGMAEEKVEAAPAPEPEPQPEEEEGEMPDWLRGMAEEEVEAEAIPVPEPEPKEEEGEMPDWLRGMAEEEVEAEAVPAPEPEEEPAMSKGDMELTLEDVDTSDIVEGEVPSWLQSLQPGAEGAAEEMPEEESLVRASVPDWVQDLRPPGTGPLPGSGPLPRGEGAAEEAEEIPEGEFIEFEIPESAEGLARAEIPDWVKELRPRVSTVEEKSPTPTQPPAGSGPLAGLPNIIPPADVIDMPEDFEAQPRPEFSEEMVEQAQLWQELLEQPRSIERPVAQKREIAGAGTTVLRLFVTVVLVLSALIVILGLSPLDMTHITASPSAGVPALNETIDALAPGDSVILAVEYGAAEAGEMRLMAETLLDHLQTQEVDILAVSTLPDGAGIVNGLLASKSITNQLAAGEAYLPSGSYGVARFLGAERDTSPALLLVLSARSKRLRWWIEQNAVADQIKMGAGVSASVGPWAMPYLQDQETIEGWLVGYPDIVSYRAVRGLPNGIYIRLLGALMFTHWGAFVLLILGAMFSLVAGRKRIG